MRVCMCVFGFSLSIYSREHAIPVACTPQTDGTVCPATNVRQRRRRRDVARPLSPLQPPPRACIAVRFSGRYVRAAVTWHVHRMAMAGYEPGMWGGEVVSVIIGEWGTGLWRQCVLARVVGRNWMLIWLCGESGWWFKKNLNCGFLNHIKAYTLSNICTRTIQLCTSQINIYTIVYSYMASPSILNAHAHVPLYDVLHFCALMRICVADVYALVYPNPTDCIIKYSNKWEKLLKVIYSTYTHKYFICTIV